MAESIRIEEARAAGLKILPLTPDRWGDFEALFGERGVSVGGC